MAVKLKDLNINLGINLLLQIYINSYKFFKINFQKLKKY